jgi:hypothetical protein
MNGFSLHNSQISLQSEPESILRLSHKAGCSPILRVVLKEIIMILITILILTLVFALGSISTLLVTEDTEEIVARGR